MSTTFKGFFEIETAYGVIYAVPSDAKSKELELTTHPRGKHLRRGGSMTVRNIAYSVAMRVRLVGEKFEGISIDEDKTETFVSAAGASDADQIEAKVNAMNIARINPVGRSVVTPFACTEIYDAAMEAVNRYYLNNKAQVEEGWQLMDKPAAPALPATGATSAPVTTAQPTGQLTQGGETGTNVNTVKTVEEEFSQPSGPTRLAALLKESARLWGRLEQIEKLVADERAKMPKPQQQEAEKQAKDATAVAA